jgi:hypothetical protein
MKNKGLLVLCAMVLLSAAPLFADTTLTGPFGYITVPTTSTPAKGALRINAGYIFDPGNFYLAANTSVMKNWEVSAAKEILTDEDAGFGATPFIVGTKYMFYQKDDFRAAAGIQLEFAGDEANVDGLPVSIYGVISENAGNIGTMNIGLGYTLGVDAGYAINFFVGVRRAIIGDKLFVIGEFTNYSVRQGLGLPFNVNRGIFNSGLDLDLTDFLKFEFTAYDLLDKFLTVGLGAELRLKVF